MKPGNKDSKFPPGRSFPGRPPQNPSWSKRGPVKPGGQAPLHARKGPAPSKVELGRMLTLHGITLDPDTLDKLWIFHQLLRKHNHDQDLTRLIGFETIVQRHYADCLVVHQLLQGKWPSPLVDIGTGAGFPGILIKLISPDTEIILSEPRPRRVEYLEMVVRELKLEKISVFGHKFTSRSFTQPVQGAITRAFELIPKTLPRLGNSLALGGQAIFMKGPNVDEEMAGVDENEYRLVKDHRYRIANTSLDRALVIYERLR